LISQPKDMMGVLLFGTEKSKFCDDSGNSTGYPHYYLLSDFDIPGAEDVKKLKALIEDSDDEDEIMVPSKEPVIISN
ncbi:hypothetical protein OFL98_30660, partial [Escherichia coli]|nr:hypothetical protein [Escherichia coli]